jgi:Ras family protein A
VRIDLWDTSTSDCYERLRPLAYPDASVFLVLYAVDEPESLVNVWETVRAPSQVFRGLM